MTNTRMLQALLNGQVKIRSDIDKVDKKLTKKIEENGKRIDKVDLQLASLEDDAPTVEEFDGLEKRVKKLEKASATI